MRRFLMVLAVVVVAGAVYVAASPGAQQAGPTAKQFAALKKQVTKLQAQVKTASQEANASLGFVLTCVAHQPVGVDSLGTSTDGYLFGVPETAAPTGTEAVSALTLAPSTEATPPYRVYVVNQSNSACVNIVNSAATLAAKRLFAFTHG